MVKDTLGLFCEFFRFALASGYLAAWEAVESRLERRTARYAMLPRGGVIGQGVAKLCALALSLWRMMPLTGDVAVPNVNRAARPCGCSDQE